MVFPTLPLRETERSGPPVASRPLTLSVGVGTNPSQILYRDRNLSRLQCRPHTVVEFVLGDLFTLWGYEADSMLTAEILSRLRAKTKQSSDNRPKR
jgi:hypothetical protein